MTYYHYCSTEVFRNIASKKSLWLSSLKASNDTQEGRTLSQIAERVCDDRLVLDQANRTHLIESIKTLESLMDCLGICFSTKEDMLSQWRGYADDGAGFAIGFSDIVFKAVELAAPPQFHLRLMEVTYDPEQQEELLLRNMRPLLDIYEAERLRMPTVLGYDDKRFASYEEALSAQRRASIEIQFKILELVDLLYATKNPAFAEEAEWRLGCAVDDHYVGCDFRSRGANLVPYLDLSFSKGTFSPFDCVWVGPKNPTPISVIKAFLAKHDIHCPVHSSRATYR